MMRGIQTGKSTRCGLTLIEIMIGLVMTLVVLVAMMRAFRFASTEIAKGRALIELSNQLRGAHDLLRRDLAGLTVDVRTSAITSTPQGYLEYIEGPCNDKSSLAPAPALGDVDVIGDFDDILAFTTKSSGRPFRGRHNGQVIESNLAEVIWFADFEDRQTGNTGLLDYDESITLRRRALLIRPDLGILGPTLNQLTSDVSARFENGQWIANSLEDLAKRENRFSRNSGQPYVLDRTELLAVRLIDANLTGSDIVFSGQDVVATDVLSFDVQVFSPDCPILVNNDFSTVPSDVNYTGTTIGTGAFVDLNCGGGTFQFAGNSGINYNSFNYLTNVLGADHVYDTFSKHYETNSLDDDLDGLVDEGMNGVDDNSGSGIDDDGEREVRPPYPFPITGLRISIRAVERTTKQVRQTSITASFMPN